MDPILSPRTRDISRLPRLRGDGPFAASAACFIQAATPPTRGWTLVEAMAGAAIIGYPAYAGMDLSAGWENRPCRGLPRLRGDGPKGLADADRGQVATPPTRGWTPKEFFLAFETAGYPAYAGMDLEAREDGVNISGLPRLRGDGPEARHAARGG